MSEDRYDYGACYEDADCRERHSKRVESELEQVRGELRRVRDAMIEYSQEACASRERAGRAERSLVQVRADLAAAQQRAAQAEALAESNDQMAKEVIRANQVIAGERDLANQRASAAEGKLHGMTTTAKQWRTLAERMTTERDAARREAEGLRNRLVEQHCRIVQDFLDEPEEIQLAILASLGDEMVNRMLAALATPTSPEPGVNWKAVAEELFQELWGAACLDEPPSLECSPTGKRIIEKHTGVESSASSPTGKVAGGALRNAVGAESQPASRSESGNPGPRDAEIERLRSQVATMGRVLKAAHHDLTTLHGLTASDGLKAYGVALSEGCDANGAWDCFVEETWQIDTSETTAQIDAALSTPTSPDPDTECECGHVSEQHENGAGCCMDGPDGGPDCTCKGFKGKRFVLSSTGTAEAAVIAAERQLLTVVEYTSQSRCSFNYKRLWEAAEKWLAARDAVAAMRKEQEGGE